MSISRVAISWSTIRIRLAPYAAALIWCLYLLWRAPGWGFFEGVPLSVASTALLAVILWLTAAGGRLSLRVGIFFLLLKASGAFLLRPHGFVGQYFANAEWSGVPEPGLYAPPDGTRVDPQLAFGPVAPRDLPLYFLNDSGRFNFYRASDPPFNSVPYSVHWRGELVSDGRQETLYVRGTDVDAELRIDNATVLTLERTSHETRSTVMLRPGFRHIDVFLSGRFGSRTFDVGEITAGATHQPFGSAAVLIQRPRIGRTLDGAVRLLSSAMDAALGGMVLLALLRLLPAYARRLWRARTHRDIVLLGAAVAFVDAFRFASASGMRFVRFGGGTDWLTYETYARDINSHGWLMTLGTSTGHAEPFYYQPLYPYFIAALHVVWGEGMWGVYLIQRLALAVSLWATWEIARTLFGTAAAAWTAIIGLVFVYWQAAFLADLLYNEILFTPLLVAWTLWIVKEARAPGSQSTLVGGVLGGLATLARSTLLLSWAPAALSLLLARHRARLSVFPVAGVFVVMSLVVGMATVRNWVASHQMVLITNSGPVNFYLGNQPPPDIAALVNQTSPDAGTKGDPFTTRTLAYARLAPHQFLTGLGQKALYTLGWFNAFHDDETPQPLLFVVWICAAIGGAAAAFLPDYRRRENRGGIWAPMAVAAAQFLVLIVIFPGARLVLPGYILLLPYLGIVPAQMANK